MTSLLLITLEKLCSLITTSNGKRNLVIQILTSQWVVMMEQKFCELVAFYIVNKLSNIIDIDSIGLYRDDGLGISESLSGPQIERKKKNIVKVFKMCGLSIIVTTNITSVDFLDVKFNLNTESYQPFRKPNNEPKYIDISSNDPPQVLKQFPKSIEKRLSEILSTKEIFDNSKHLYEKALQESGFKEKLCYQQRMLMLTPIGARKNANAR